MHYVIAYDVESDKRRTKMMKKLKDKGERVQYSVLRWSPTRGACRNWSPSSVK